MNYQTVSQAQEMARRNNENEAKFRRFERCRRQLLAAFGDPELPDRWLDEAARRKAEAEFQSIRAVGYWMPARRSVVVPLQS